jgi:hypothetical protein
MTTIYGWSDDSNPRRHIYTYCIGILPYNSHDFIDAQNITTKALETDIKSFIDLPHEEQVELILGLLRYYDIDNETINAWKKPVRDFFATAKNIHIRT